VKVNDLPGNPGSNSSEPGSRANLLGSDRAQEKQSIFGKRRAVVGAILVLLVLAAAFSIRGTLFWPINTHLKLNFSKDVMTVESTTIPKVNGVYFEISNPTSERHQVVVFDEGIPYNTEGFLQNWQPFHRSAGKTVEPGQSASYQGIFVYERPLRAGRHFLVFCNEPGHYDRGEHVELVVK